MFKSKTTDVLASNLGTLSGTLMCLKNDLEHQLVSLDLFYNHCTIEPVYYSQTRLNITDALSKIEKCEELANDILGNACDLLGEVLKYEISNW